MQEHGYNTQTELKDAFSESQKQLDHATKSAYGNECRFEKHQSSDPLYRTIFAQKALYTEFLKAKNKGRFRKEHTAEIQAYEEARDWLKSFYPDGKMLPIKTLKEQKSQLAGTDRPAKIIHPISKGSDTRFKNRRQKCGSYSQQPGSEKAKDSGTRIINHFTKEELQYDTNEFNVSP